ncbi:hypothetical protein UA08_06412 [Talaromyces atroroseus]|uniref:Uncharacterized protein n=1 Tax=Talaromyces atroroseus TaxID=1441469 RepID=A0A225AXD7_TALAT|nr:hypothetical protein UA08_06412 [Talaromyces atroroseus]OKL58167.1 hypothetical protein UA08_06412 [Talaromyces atroroseus]
MNSVASFEAHSPSSEDTRLDSVDEKLGHEFSTLEVVPPSNLEHYQTPSQVRNSFYRNWFQSSGLLDDKIAIIPPPPVADFKPTTPGTSPEGVGPTTPVTICGMPQRAFWIVFGVIAGLLALGAIIGGVVGEIENNRSPTPVVTVTTTVAPSSTAATTTSVCAGGTGEGNLSGLCSFACSYGYCPAGSCTCTASGTPVPTPPTTGVDGVPLSGENEAYEGLCSFCCNHGYCPSSACTTNSTSALYTSVTPASTLSISTSSIPT